MEANVKLDSGGRFGVRLMDKQSSRVLTCLAYTQRIVYSFALFLSTRPPFHDPLLIAPVTSSHDLCHFLAMAPQGKPTLKTGSLCSLWRTSHITEELAYSINIDSW